MTLPDAPYLWLIIGMLFLALEAFGAPGVGFFFAGLGAITAALAAQAGYAADLTAQMAWFFGASVLWAILLWKPIKKFNLSRPEAGYQNMTGGVAEVAEGGLHKGKTGKVRWSGTQMEARLAADVSAESLEAGTSVVIQEVKGNTLIVVPQV